MRQHGTGYDGTKTYPVDISGMFNADRLRARMAERSLSQSELARRVGVSQASIYRLVKGEAYGSKHLHRIARELGTTPAYLAGEIDDPDENAPVPPPPATIQHVMMAVALPSEAALARMFLGMLKTSKSAKTMDEQAVLLAKRLPIALSQLRDLLPETAPPAPGPAERPVALAMPHHGSQR